MKTRTRTRTIAILGFAMLCLSLSAQDIHWSQFANSPLNLSPGLTGIHRGDVRFAGNYRNQWRTVPVDYMTFSGGVDMKFRNRGEGNGYFAGGFLFDYDRAGDSQLSWTKIGLSGSYTQVLNPKNLLTAGLQLAFNQRAFKTEDLRFDNQFDGEIFNAALGSGENFQNTSTGFGDFSAGINYRFQNPDSRTRLNLGAALFHINRPNVSFFEQDEKQLSNRTTVYGQGVFQMGSRFDLVLLAMGQWQKPHQEWLLGAAARIHLDTDLDEELALQIGLDLRPNDAIIPHLELHYRQWLFGLSYDVNTSPFNRVTNNRGGPEFSVIHILTLVKPPEFKICPIF